MDTKRLLTMMLLSFAVIFGWQMLMFRVYGPPKKPGQETATTQPIVATTQGAAATTSATSTTTTTTTTGSVAATQSTAATQGSGSTIAAAPVPAVRIVSTAATQPTGATLENEVMRVELSPMGAGVESVVLKDFHGPNRQGFYTFQQPYEATNPASRAMATRMVTINGIGLDVAGFPWVLAAADSKSATFELDFGLAKVRKIYQLRAKSEPGQGYEIGVRHEIVNTANGAAGGGVPVNAKIVFNGANVPPSESEQGHDRNILTGYDDGYERVTVAHFLTDQYDAKTPTRDLTKGSDGIPLLWGGGSSVYFNALVRPEPLDPGKAAADYVETFVTTAINPDSRPIDRQVTTTFTTKELAVAPNQTVSLPSQVYFGPRWRAVLNQAAYSQFPRDYDETLVLTSGPCGFCTFGWLVNGLVSLLNVFHWVFGGFASRGDWGLAIIALVVLVRLLLHPITKRAQISMLRMGKMGPEVERLKAKHKDDKDALNREMMQLYKDQGIGAYLGCLPMFLQMPIWIALWSALNSTFELRQAPFLWGWTWIDDLARPDRLIAWSPINFSLPLFGAISISSFNLLPLLLAVVFYLQQEFTPKPPATTPEQETQQKMMKWMSLLFPVFLYNGPSGLNLYILTSTAIGIIESKRIRDHIKQQEALEKEGKIIVDAGMKKRGDDDKAGGGKGGAKKPAQPKKSGLAGWLEQMQGKAEEIRRQAEKGRK